MTTTSKLGRLAIEADQETAMEIWTCTSLTRLVSVEVHIILIIIQGDSGSNIQTLITHSGIKKNAKKPL